MRKYVMILLLCVSVAAQMQLDYYLPEGEYDKNIPTPKQFLGYEVGEWHFGHDHLVYYMKKLGELSERFSVHEYARSHEARPLIVVTITSADNHKNLEEIQKKHRSLRSGSDNVDVKAMPAVVYIGHTIHGNEPSGSNAALAVAYYLAAAQGEAVEKMLQETIILLDPCMNPDGYNRFASWVNSHKSKNPIAAAISREHNEAWPRGRTNHYWFDLNRDWLLTQHPESRGRVKIFQQWQPNILTDHHEMGRHSTYFFQPGVPQRTHPLTPQKNQDLTKKIAAFHAGKLDEIGSLYFSEERFDDFYYGKGSTYPDVQGAVGILFEQASSRGHLQECEHGELSFPFTIRNQVKTMFSTLEAAQNLRVELLEYRRDFYTQSRELAQKDAVQAYIVNDNNDKDRLSHFALLLQRHDIEVFHLAKPITVDGIEYTEDNSLLVPTNQAQYRLIKSLFEKRTSFNDSIFYDVSAWTMPMAFHLGFAELKNKAQLTYLQGENYQHTFASPTTTFDDKAYAYLFAWDGYYAPRALNRLLQIGAKVKVATKEFSAVVNGEEKRFTYGTILVAMGIQTDKAQIARTMKTIAAEDHVAVYRAQTGFTPVGMDLGSGNFHTVQPPKAIMLVGPGVNSYDAGEVWHLFDMRFDIPLVMVDVNDFSSVDMYKYNTLIMVDGSYNLNADDTQKLQDWVTSGGTLVAAKRAVNWAVAAKIAALEFETSAPMDNKRLPYATRVQNEGAQITGGAILEGKTDLTHPLLYGYHRDAIHLFRRGNMAIRKPQNVYSVPIEYTDTPLVSGYMSEENKKLIKSTPAIVVCGKGSGKVICMADNLNFRAFWYGTNKIFINSVLFGHIIDGGSVERQYLLAIEFRCFAKLTPIKRIKIFKGKSLQLLTTRPQNKNISLWFQEIANCLLNQVQLVVNGALYRFVEIEFYYQNSSDHCDPSVHCDPLQKTNEKWYFHRSGGTYKGGTFKGLDITFAENDVFGGIIIRGIENEHGDVIDGPCLCVDHILQKTNCSTVAELDKLVSDYSVWDAKSPLYIKINEECDKREIIASPRVGLTLAYRDKAAQMSEYIMKNYRYLSVPRKTKKGKVYMILALHAQGKISEEIRDAVGSTKKAIGSYIGFFQEGQKRQDFSAYIGKKLDTKLTAQLYGTWWEIFGKQQSS